MTEPWTQDWIVGRFGERTISDRPTSDNGADSTTVRMGNYVTWRRMFNGKFINQELPGAASSDAATKNYRWPSRLNLYRTYAMVHAAWMWGRAETAKESDDLFDLSLDKSIPGLGGREMESTVPRFAQALEYWWSFFQHLLRPSGATQQWAGGCWVKVSWNPFHPAAVYGCILESLDPEYVWPIYDSLSYNTLLAVKIVFQIPPVVAIEKYGFSDEQVKELVENGLVRVVEYWSREQFYIKLGPEGQEKVARLRGIAGAPGEQLEGANPWKHPFTNQGTIPVFYIPRVRTQGFYGDSLMEELDGPIQELNKAFSDLGDALNDATHTSGYVADNHAAGTRANQAQSFSVPRGEIMNLGITPTGQQQGRYFPTQGATIPSSAIDYSDKFQDATEQVAMLTPGSRGKSSATTGFGVAMEMLPTLYIVDWMRSHWATTIGGRSGINELLGIIWYIKKQQSVYFVPGGITPLALMVRQRVNYKAVIPRDRVATIQELSTLAANNVLPPREILKRLGDIENIDDTLGELMFYLMWVSAWDAAVAGRPIKIGKDPRDESEQRPKMPLPEVAGPTQPKPGGTINVSGTQTSNSPRS